MTLTRLNTLTLTLCLREYKAARYRRGLTLWREAVSFTSTQLHKATFGMELSPLFLEDFAALLVCCERAGLKLLPSLLDFHFCFPGLSIPGSGGIVKGGRSDVFIDPQKRQQFMERVVRPLLAVAAAHRGAIYAFELINEPEWCTRPSGPLAELSHLTHRADPNQTVARDDMRAFLREAAGLVNGAGLLSTVGFASHASLSAWDSPGLGLTLHQLHYYAEPAPLPAQPFDPRWPAIVGEFATAPHKPWPELKTKQDIASRLRRLEALGYPAAFLWSANREEERNVPAAVDYSPAMEARIRSYLRG